MPILEKAMLKNDKGCGCIVLNPKILCHEVLGFVPFTDITSIRMFVTDDMIKEHLESGKFIDTRSNIGRVDTAEHHALRIASLVKLIRENVKLNLIELVYESEDKLILAEGWHRLRAHLYCSRSIHVDTFS